MVPLFEWDDVEHIAPSFDEPRSSSGDSSLTDLWEEADVKEEKLAIKKTIFLSFVCLLDMKDFYQQEEEKKPIEKSKFLTNHYSLVVVFQCLSLIFPSNA
jgi:hypothetical protein